MALDQELAHYDKHVAEWKCTHAGQFVVIKGETVLGFFGTEDEALSAGAAAYGVTSFLVRKVGEGIEQLRIPTLECFWESDTVGAAACVPGTARHV